MKKPVRLFLALLLLVPLLPLTAAANSRSEERRVGKEC